MVVVGLLIYAAFFGFLVWSWFGAHPSVARFTAAHRITLTEADLPRVRAVLRRTYRGRVLGALAGAIVLGGAALTIGRGAAFVAVIVGLIVGSMVGIALAQDRTRVETVAVRRASLDARTVREYTTRWGPWWVAATASACVLVSVLVVATAPAGLGPYAPLLAGSVAALLIVPVGRVLQRRIVEAPRDELDPGVDDVLRSTAVRAVHHAVLGVLLCALAVAMFAGSATHSTSDVLDDRGVVYTVPPGSTSISVDTGLIQSGHPHGPIRVYWIEANGSEHRSRPLLVSGSPRLGGDDSVALIQLYGWGMVGAAIAALVQWWRAATSWRRPAANRQGISAGPAALPA